MNEWMSEWMNERRKEGRKEWMMAEQEWFYFTHEIGTRKRAIMH